MASAARRKIIGGGGAPINKSRRRRPQIVGGGGAAHSSNYQGRLEGLTLLCIELDMDKTIDIKTLTPRIKSVKKQVFYKKIKKR